MRAADAAVQLDAKTVLPQPIAQRAVPAQALVPHERNGLFDQRPVGPHRAATTDRTDIHRSVPEVSPVDWATPATVGPAGTQATVGSHVVGPSDRGVAP